MISPGLTPQAWMVMQYHGAQLFAAESVVREAHHQGVHGAETPSSASWIALELWPGLIGLAALILGAVWFVRACRQARAEAGRPTGPGVGVGPSGRAAPHGRPGGAPTCHRRHSS